MDCYRAIVQQLGRPTKSWPNHQGKLSNVDRFKLVSFLVANDVPRAIIAKFADTSQITVSGKARKDWDYLVKKSHDNEAYRSRTTAYKLGVGIVYLTGTLVNQARAPSAPVVVVELLNLL
jgi:hypothetical protein